MAKSLEELFSGYKYVKKNEAEVLGVKVDIPVKYLDASAFMVFFSVSLKKVNKLINNQRVKPVIVGCDKCLVGITIFEYRKCDIGPYHEFTFSIPILVDSSINIPWLPLIFESWFKSLGHLVVMIGADTDISVEHLKLFGYPMEGKKIGIDFKEEGDILKIGLKDGGKNILVMEPKIPKKYKVVNKQFNTYSINDSGIYNVRLNTFVLLSSISFQKIKLNLGDHELSAMLRDLGVGDRSLFSVYYKRAIEIADAPKKI